MISIQEARAQGLKRYFTGKPCPKGHVAERITSSRACTVCARAATNIWQRSPKNHPHIRSYARGFYEENSHKFSERSKKLRLEQPEKIKRYKRKEYLKHKAKYNAAAKAWREANPDRARELGRKKVLANPEVYRTYKRNYKARKKAATGSHSAADIREIFFAQRGKCGYCRIKVGKKYHVDHIVALVKGGSNNRRNLQILCGPCNNGKSAKDPIDFAQSRGMLL